MTPKHIETRRGFWERKWFRIAAVVIPLFGGISVTSVWMTTQRAGTAMMLPFMAPYVHGEIQTHILQERHERDSCIRNSNDSVKAYFQTIAEKNNNEVIEKLARIPIIQQSLDSDEKKRIDAFRKQKAAVRFLNHN